MAMENTQLIGDFPIETPLASGFPLATFDYRRVCLMWTCLEPRRGWVMLGMGAEGAELDFDAGIICLEKLAFGISFVPPTAARLARKFVCRRRGRSSRNH